MTYKGASKSAETEIVIRKSRFIGCTAPIEDARDAVRFLKEVRDKYRDASHVCYAYRTDPSGSEARFSDDGEPKGTAGMPILEVLNRSGATRTAIAVVRYFGGIKLGAGGLTRAYANAAAQALDASEPKTFVLKKIFEVRLDYEAASAFRIEGETRRAYGDRVTIEIASADEEALYGALAAKLGGAPKPIRIGERFLPQE